MKVGVVQLAPGTDRESNIRATIRLLREAVSRGTELVVFPELCTSPYQLLDQDLGVWAETIPSGDAIQRWLDEIQASRTYLIAGLLEKNGGGYCNSAVVLAPSGLVGVYRKAHLFGWERKRLSAGPSAFLATDLPSLRLGVVICYDLRFLEAVRLLALDEVQLLCVPTTWTDVGKPPAYGQGGLCGAAHLAVGHAYANGLFVLCAGRSGREGDVGYMGNSLVAGPGGEILAGPAGPTEQGLFVADIEPERSKSKEVGAYNHLFRDRRSDLYTLNSKEPLAVSDSEQK